ncbi:MAG: hypothetical protein AABZ60_08965 [Planctomycetota bacterium]
MKYLYLLFVVLMGMTGCHSTLVHLEEPQGAVLVYDGQSYVFPTRVEFERPGDLGDSYISPITLSFRSFDGRTVTVSGELEVFGHIQHETDIINPHEFRLSNEEFGQLSNGIRVVLERQSKAGYRIFKMDLRP